MSVDPRFKKIDASGRTDFTDFKFRHRNCDYRQSVLTDTYDTRQFHGTLEPTQSKVGKYLTSL